MTEAQWLVSTNALALLAESALETEKQKRRLRLFSIACCRQLARWVVNERLWKCLEASERYADGRLKDSGLDHWTAEANKLWIAAKQSQKGVRNAAAVLRTHHAIAYTCLTDKYDMHGKAAGIILGAEEDFGKTFVNAMHPLFSHLLRDIFGNPFRPASINPSWLTWNDGAIGKIAEGIYDKRAFDRVPILADALEEAGCTDASILPHCRQPGEHARGCWVIDMLLGKS